MSVSYRGVENPWGNIWKHINGVNIWGDGNLGGGQPYIANDFVFNESANSDNYEAVGFTLPNSGGFIKAMGYGTEAFDWLLMPSDISGGTSVLPVGDLIEINSLLSGYKVYMIGSTWNGSYYTGAFCCNCKINVNGRSFAIGGRLIHIPQYSY